MFALSLKTLVSPTMTTCILSNTLIISVKIVLYDEFCSPPNLFGILGLFLTLYRWSGTNCHRDICSWLMCYLWWNCSQYIRNIVLVSLDLNEINEQPGIRLLFYGCMEIISAEEQPNHSPRFFGYVVFLWLTFVLPITNR